MNRINVGLIASISQRSVTDGRIRVSFFLLIPRLSGFLVQESERFLTSGAVIRGALLFSFSSSLLHINRFPGSAEEIVSAEAERTPSEVDDFYGSDVFVQPQSCAFLPSCNKTLTWREKHDIIVRNPTMIILRTIVQTFLSTVLCYCSSYSVGLQL